MTVNRVQLDQLKLLLRNPRAGELFDRVLFVERRKILHKQAIMKEAKGKHDGQ